MKQVLHSQIRYVLYILPIWESSGEQNEQEGLIQPQVVGLNAGITEGSSQDCPTSQSQTK